MSLVKFSQHIPNINNIIVEGYIRTIQTKLALIIPTTIVKIILYYRYLGTIFKFYTKQLMSIECLLNFEMQSRILTTIYDLFEKFEFDQESIQNSFDSRCIHHLIDMMNDKHLNYIKISDIDYHKQNKQIITILTFVQKYNQNSSILANLPQKWLWKLLLIYENDVKILAKLLYLLRNMSIDERTIQHFVKKHKDMWSQVPHYFFARAIDIAIFRIENQVMHSSTDIVYNVSYLLLQLAIYDPVFRGSDLHESLLFMIPSMLDFVLDKMNQIKYVDIILNITKTLFAIICHVQDINIYYQNENNINNSNNNYDPFFCDQHINHNFTFCHKLFQKLGETKLLQKYIKNALNSTNISIQTNLFNLIHAISINHISHWRLQESVNLLLSANYINIMIQYMKCHKIRPWTDIQILTQWAQYIKSSNHSELISHNADVLEIISIYLKDKNNGKVSSALKCIKQIVSHSNVELTINLFLWKNGKIIDIICNEAQLLNVNNCNKCKIILIFLYLAQLILRKNSILQKRNTLTLMTNKLKTNNVLDILHKFCIITKDNKPIKSNISLYECEIINASQYLDILIKFCNNN